MSTILIVDDDPIMLVLIRKLLKDDGYNLLTASDGLDAQARLSGGISELKAVLLDWTMPGMSGIDLLKWIKVQRQFDNLPVIMQTGMDKPEHIKEGIDAGAFYYLVKPYQREVLRSVVRAAVFDLVYKESLVKRLHDSEQSFSLLEEGIFRFRTIDDAENLAMRIAFTSPIPEQAMYISEILINAVEHGNLGIGYFEKSELLTKNQLSSEIERRMLLPENTEKYVELRFKKHETHLTIEVEDRGQGFDYARFLEVDPNRVFDNHGRGIAMARRHLMVDYVGAGNKVIVTIPFN